MQSDSRPAVYDASQDGYITAEHPPRKTEGGTWERGRQNLYTTRIHKSETLDYGILLTGERILVTTLKGMHYEWVRDLATLKQLKDAIGTDRPAGMTL